MKKVCWVLGLLLGCYSCSELEVSVDDISHDLLLSEITTRVLGDGKYDALGYGYDATEEYLHPLSVRNPVLDIGKYEHDFPNRVQTPSASYGYDKMYSGYSSSDYVKDITSDTKATATMGYGQEKDTAFFSGTITSNSYFSTSYSYSDKYSFASLDLVRNLKRIYINDEVNVLTQYLSDDFKVDLERLSADRIVERYGTHVLTDFIIGGRYKLLFRSVIANVKDSSMRKNAVESAFKFSLDKIGVNYNLENTETVNESLVRENRSKELYVLFYGGSGTNIVYDLEKGTPTSVDIKSWENSLSTNNSCLTSITWKETYPIYEFISDPLKRREIKEAVIRHIEASKLNVLELIPLYLYCNPRQNHYTTSNPDVVANYPEWEYYGMEGYILKNQLPGTIPLYEYYHDYGFDHYTTTISDVISGDGWVKLGVSGYVYANKGINNMDAVQLYDYFYQYDKRSFDHYTTTDPNISYKFPGWKMCNRSGYIYPVD